MSKNLGKITLEIDPDNYAIKINMDCTVNNKHKICIMHSLAMSLASWNSEEASRLLIGVLKLMSIPDLFQPYTRFEGEVLPDALDKKGEEGNPND